jgi:hypothetical protein
MKSAQRLVLSLLCAGIASASAQDGSVRIISQTGHSLDSSLTLTVTSYAPPILNNSGKVAFSADAGSNQIVAVTDGTTIRTIVTDLGTDFDKFSAPLMNETGMVAFYGKKLTTAEGIYTGIGGTTVLSSSSASLSVYPKAISLGDTGVVVFQKDTLNTQGTAVLSSSLLAVAGGTTTTLATVSSSGTFSLPVINSVGVIAFQKSDTTQGIYTTHGGILNTIATTQTVAPGINAVLTNLGTPALNDSGTVAFMGIAGSPIFSAPKGIFVGSGGSLTALATTSQSAPGIGGNFSKFFDPVINNAGTVAFRAQSANSGDGIYAGNTSGGTLRAIATTGQAAPNLTGNFVKFEYTSINNGGTVAFTGFDAANKKGLYLSDGTQTITVAYMGQSMSGSTISDVIFTGGDRSGGSQFNDNGQIAYQANLADKSSTIVLFTPTLHYRGTTGGTWGARSNWTVGIQPASVHDVFIDPTSSLGVAGPSSPVSVKSLTINGAGGATATLALQNTGALTATNGVTNGANGALTGSGKINGNLTSAGLLAPGTASTTGSFNVYGDVTLQATSHLSLDLSGLVRKTNYDFVNVSGAFTLGGALDISLLNGFAPQSGQSFDLFDAGSLAGAFSAVNLPTLTGGLTWNTSLLATAGIISVNPGGPLIATWAPGATGSWAASGNWTGGVPNGVGATATFASTGGASTAVSVSGPKTVGSIVFGGTGGFVVTGGATDVITMDNSSGTPTISGQAGSNTLNAPLSLQQNTEVSAANAATVTLGGDINGAHSLTTSGAGTVNLEGAQNYAALNANAGTTNVDGSFSGGAVTVGTNASLTFGASQTLTSLNIGGGATLTFESSGTGAMVTPAAVPEPGTMALLASWTALILWRTRRLRSTR